MIRVMYEVTYTIITEPLPRIEHVVDFTESYEATKFIRDHCRWFASTRRERVMHGEITLEELIG